MRPQQRHRCLADRLSELSYQCDYRMNEENRGLGGYQEGSALEEGEGALFGGTRASPDEEVRGECDDVEEELAYLGASVFQVSWGNAFRGRKEGTQLPIAQADEEADEEPEVGKHPGEGGA